MEDTSQRLRNYIAEISGIQEETPFDLKRLRDCTDRFELTDEDQEKLQELAASHSKQSEKMLMDGKVESAVISLERAVEILPFSCEYRNRLAQLYLIRSEKGGDRENDRNLARENALLSLKLERGNPISRSILKEIKTKELVKSGKDQNRKLIIPLIAVAFLILAAALATQNRFPFSFLKSNNDKPDAAVPAQVPKEAEKFSSSSFKPQLNGIPDNCTLDISKSEIAATNGSFSYTLQGHMQSQDRAIKSAVLDIIFRKYGGDILFEKKVPLLGEGEIYYPGEPILIDQFFYIDYLPPDIDGVYLQLSGVTFADQSAVPGEPTPLKIQWTAPRPEGVSLKMNLLEYIPVKGYSARYGQLKIELVNTGTITINNLAVSLDWQNFSGESLFDVQKDLIKKENPPVKSGENRIFYLFLELPPVDRDGNSEMFIDIDRINE